MVSKNNMKYKKITWLEITRFSPNLIFYIKHGYVSYTIL